MNEEILSQLEQLLKQEVKDFGLNFAKDEQTVMQMMMLLGKGLLQRVLDSRNNGYWGCSMPCRCGGSMKFVQHRNRDLHTLFGWIKLKRAYYYCADCGISLAPYDQTSGLGSEQLSPALAKACCVLAVDDSFEQTSRKIEQLFGQKVSDNTIERAVYQVGSIAYKQQEQQMEEFFEYRQIPPADCKPDMLYIASDGTTAHEVDGWHEVKIGSVYWEDERFGSDKRYVGFFENSDSFVMHLWL